MKFKRYANYKDSEVEWLGEIPEHWNVVRLKYASSINDETLSENTDRDFEFLYVDIGSVDSVKGIQEREFMRFEASPSRARRIVSEGDVIISTVRTYLRAIAPIDGDDENLVVSTGFAVIRPKKTLNSKFAAYALRAPYFVDSVVANAVGVSYPAIGENAIGGLFIAIPSLEEQFAISYFLYRETAKIDALIEKKERLIELLYEKRTVLITHAVTKGLDPNAPMKDSGIEWLGNIPTNWKALQFRRGILFLTDFEANGSFSTIKESVNLDRGEPYAWYVRATDLENEKIGISEETRYCDRETYQFLRKTSLQGGELLVTKRGEIGKVYLMPILNRPATLGPNLYLVKLNAILFPQFAYLWFSSNLGRPQLELANKSTTIGAVYKDDIKSCICLFPSFEEQKAICKFLNRKTAKIDSLIFKVYEAIGKLKEYRTALISAAVTGKIDVREEAA